MLTSIANKLKSLFGDKETRHTYAVEYVSAGIPFQIHELREANQLSQTALAKKAGMAPERISVLEDPNYEFVPKITTLQKLAEVFDVPLIVRFGTWSEIYDWQQNLSNEKLAPKPFVKELEAQMNKDVGAFLLERLRSNISSYDEDPAPLEESAEELWLESASQLSGKNEYEQRNNRGATVPKMSSRPS